jgi:hypothetical protein
MRDTDKILEEMDRREVKKTSFSEYVKKVENIISEELETGSESSSYSYGTIGSVEYDGISNPSTDQSNRNDFIKDSYNKMISGEQKMYSLSDNLPVTYSKEVPNSFSYAMATKLTIVIQEYVKRHPGTTININDGLRSIHPSGLRSPHNSGNAADVRAKNAEMAKELADLAYHVGFGGIAIGKQNNYFVHMDTAKVLRWDYNDGKYGPSYKYVDRYESPSKPWKG